MKAVRTLALGALWLLPALVPLPAHAEEGGSGHYMPGANASFIDALPGKPGLGVANFFNYYDGSASGTKQMPWGGLIAGNLDATSYADTVVVLYQTPLKLLGGGYAFLQSHLDDDILSASKTLHLRVNNPEIFNSLADRLNVSRLLVADLNDCAAGKLDRQVQSLLPQKKHGSNKGES